MTDPTELALALCTDPRRTRRGLRWQRCLLVLATLAAVVACKAPQGAGPDTDSHWLSTCTMDDDCGAGLQCLCERCTTPCEDDAECGSLSGVASCAATTGCGTEPACIAECMTDDDCPSSAGTCRDEHCVDLGEATSASSAIATDGNATDAGECAPAGTYGMISVIGNEANSNECPPLSQGPLNIRATGWIEAFPGCEELGCNEQDCTEIPVSASSCSSTVVLRDECTSLGEGRSITFETSFVGDVMTLVMTDSDSPGAGVCSYEMTARLATSECTLEDPCECTNDGDCPRALPTCFANQCTANVGTAVAGPGSAGSEGARGQ